MTSLCGETQALIWLPDDGTVNPALDPPAPSSTNDNPTSPITTGNTNTAHACFAW